MAAPLTAEQANEKKTMILTRMAEGLSFRAAIMTTGVAVGTGHAWRRGDAMFDEAIKLAQMRSGRGNSGARVAVARKAIDVPVETVPDLVKEVCEAIRNGLPLDYCCLIANIQRATLKQWMLDDEEVAAAINKAQAQNLLWWISKIRSGAEKDWRAALAYLERIFPQLFAEVKAVEITTKSEDKEQESFINVTPDHVIQKLMGMSDDDLSRLAGNSL
jgi:hypothetical protein